MVVAAAVLHPPTFDPREPGPVWQAAAGHGPAWIADHVLVGLGLVLWTMGVVQWAWRVVPDGPSRPWLRWGAGSLVVALALWLAALVVELTSLPLAAASDPESVPSWFAGLWPAVLGWGYTGAALQWAALAMFAVALQGQPDRAGVLWGRWGLATVPLGWAGLLAGWIWPAQAPWLVAGGLAPATVWLVLALFRLPPPLPRS